MFTRIRPFTLVVLAAPFVVLGLTAAAQAQTTWYVDDDAGPGGDGATWPTAFEYLQDALAVANPGDEIHVGQGMYQPDRDADYPDGTGQRGATFQLISGVGLYGGYRGLSGGGDPDDRDIAAFETVLSGDLAGNDGPNFQNNDENSYHVVTGSGCDQTAIVDGCTVTAGNADGDDPHRYGGGMYNEDGDPTLANCTIRANAAEYGAGIRNDASSPVLSNCTISDNATLYSGGGMHNSQSGATLTDCTFSGNSALHGGGMFNWNGSDPTLMNCTFVANTADKGGGMRNHSGRPILTNCAFIGNLASQGGGVFNWTSSRPTLFNCTFAANSAADGRALACDSYQQQHPSTVSMANCVLWNGGDEVWNNDASTITITYSDVFGGWPDEGNIDADPLFVDPGNDDYHLATGSPCNDAGDNEAVPADGLDLDGDGDTQEPVPFDLDRNPRFIDDPNADDTGNPDPDYPDLPIVDMGAYEFQVPGDLNGDGCVDHSDLGILLADWGCTGGDCPGDADGDGNTDHSDLGIVLAHWGEGCP